MGGGVAGSESKASDPKEVNAWLETHLVESVAWSGSKASDPKGCCHAFR